MTLSEPVHGEVWERHRLASTRMAGRNDQRVSGPGRKLAYRVRSHHGQWRPNRPQLVGTRGRFSSPLSTLASRRVFVEPWSAPLFHRFRHVTILHFVTNAKSPTSRHRYRPILWTVLAGDPIGSVGATSVHSDVLVVRRVL